MNRDHSSPQNSTTSGMNCNSGRNSASLTSLESSGMRPLAVGYEPTAVRFIMTVSSRAGSGDDKFDPHTCLFQDDVVCGRGKKCYSHVGNDRFRKRVVAMLDEYSRAKSKVDKSAVLSAVVEQVREASPNGGFIKQDDSGQWYEVGDFLAREKTSQAFRDALSDQYKSSNVAKKKKRQEEQARASDKIQKIARSEFEIASRMNQLSSGFGMNGIADEATLLRTNYDILNRLNRLSDMRRERSAPQRNLAFRNPGRSSSFRTPGRSSSYRFSETRFQPISEDEEFERRPPAFTQSDFLARPGLPDRERGFSMGSSSHDRDFRRRVPMHSRSEIIYRTRRQFEERHSFQRRMYNAEEEDPELQQMSQGRVYSSDGTSSDSQNRQLPRSLPGSPQTVPSYETELDVSDFHSSMPNMDYRHMRGGGGGMEPLDALHHSMPNMQYNHYSDWRGDDDSSFDEPLVDAFHSSLPEVNRGSNAMAAMHQSMPNICYGGHYSHVGPSDDELFFEDEEEPAADVKPKAVDSSSFDTMSPRSKKEMFNCDDMAKQEDMTVDLEFDAISPPARKGVFKSEEDLKKSATIADPSPTITSAQEVDILSKDLGVCLNKLHESTLDDVASDDENPFEPIPLSPERRRPSFTFERVDRRRFRRSDAVCSPAFEKAF